MARLFKTDGTVQDVSPANGVKFNLQEAQRLVGGYIEVVHLNNGEKLMVYEEAALTGQDKNEHVSNLANAIGAKEVLPDVLHGDVIWCSKKEAVW